jgi:thymidine kinase
MFGGKSSTLITKIERLTIAGKSCIVVKYKGDTRYSATDVVSHNNRIYPCRPLEDDELKEFIPTLMQYDVIGIDEGQFFESLVVICQTLADAGKTVLVSGLLATSMDTPFKPIADLAIVADDIIFNKAVCMKCGADASKSYRYDKSNTVVNIGSSDKYEARCRKCFNMSE